MIHTHFSIQSQILRSITLIYLMDLFFCTGCLVMKMRCIRRHHMIWDAMSSIQSKQKISALNESVNVTDCRIWDWMTKWVWINPCAFVDHTTVLRLNGQNGYELTLSWWGLCGNVCMYYVNSNLNTKELCNHTCT